MSQAKANDTVKVHYTGRLTNGEVFDSSEGRDPLEFTVGAGQMIKGFDAAVNGMGLNEKKTVTIPADEAYGQPNDAMIQEVPKASLPADLNPSVGMQLMASSPDGQQMPVKVVEVTEENIKVDANHPLAGQDLTFDIELVSIG